MKIRFKLSLSRSFDREYWKELITKEISFGSWYQSWINVDWRQRSFLRDILIISIKYLTFSMVALSPILLSIIKWPASEIGKHQGRDGQYWPGNFFATVFKINVQPKYLKCNVVTPLPPRRPVRKFSNYSLQIQAGWFSFNMLQVLIVYSNYYKIAAQWKHQ